jgi:hypothetical protein
MRVLWLTMCALIPYESQCVVEKNASARDSHPTTACSV